MESVSPLVDATSDFGPALTMESKNMRILLRASLVGFAALSLPAIGAAQLPPPLPHPPETPPPSLKTVAIPLPGDLDRFVTNREAAIRLGKALFWDTQVGGDGKVACATCHFHAGADSRSVNQLNPGLIAGDMSFDVGNGPNHKLLPSDYPFHKLANAEDRDSEVLSDANDVTGSAGVFNTRFVDFVRGKSKDNNTSSLDPLGFTASNINVRRVTGRNTPTSINAIFNTRNFWDGRANFRFNGCNPFGDSDPDARVLETEGGSAPEKTRISLERASLASQACGPPLSDVEMSGAGRTFLKLGKKMLGLRPLAQQKVSPDDGVLGTFMDASGKGLNTTYANMIREAFDPRWWDSSAIVDGDKEIVESPTGSTSEFTMTEANFSLFWGLSVMLYESTLVSDDSPYDRFAEGNTSALTMQQQYGLGLFIGDPATGGVGGACAACHAGPEFTGAAFTARLTPLGPGIPSEGLVERMIMGDGNVAIYDGGFYNIGVRPTEEDPGIGGSDPFGHPLSLSRRAKSEGFQDPDLITLFPPVDPSDRDAVQGAFKVPTLRNIELTGPYFHNGSYASLFSVVQFYTRGGNFHDDNIDNLDADIARQKDLIGHPDRQFALVAFLTSLTDDRVRYYRAPFDHPEIAVPAGHTGIEQAVSAASGNPLQSKEGFKTLAATGRAGQATPIKSFLGLPALDATIPAPSPVFSNMVFLASEMIDNSSHRPTQGDMFCNGTITFEGGPAHTHVGDLTAGGTVYLSNVNTIDGSVTTKKTVVMSGASSITHFKSQKSMFAPVVMPALDFTAGGDNVNVDEMEEADLEPGSYGDVVLKKGSTLRLREGEFFFNSLFIGGGARLQYTESGDAPAEVEFGMAPTERTIVNVVGDVWLGTAAQITSGSESNSDRFRLNALASVQFEASRDNVIHGTLFAPNSLVSIGPNTTFRGSVFARAISIASGVEFKHHHAPMGGPVSKISRVIPKDDDPTPHLDTARTPLAFSLSQNQPNPFNPTTTIRFALPDTRDVQLHIYDVTGRLVRTLASGPMLAGRHVLSWDGTDENDNRVASGVYLYKLIAGHDTDQKKMIVLK
jgi:cytochrome c peroxidase